MTNRPADLELTWSGPYSWFWDSPQSVFNCPLAEAPGVYLWTVETPNGRLIYYVGQTQAGFAKRQYEHFCEYLSGAYTVNDVEQFAKGIRTRIYKGFAYRKPAWRLASEFMQRVEELVPAILEKLQIIELWFAPLDSDTRIQRRVEGAIIQALYDAGGLAGSFQEEGMRMELRRPDEDPIRISFTPPNLALGLPAWLEV